MTAPLFISIVGPTAVGKTSLALWLAEQLLAAELIESVDLVSADSRQVYQGLELATGADVPADFVRHHLSVAELDEKQHVDPSSFSLLPSSLPYFQRGAIRWHGVSVIKPDQEWSMGHFRQLVEVVTQAFDSPKRLIIIVGGTGLYHEYATSRDPQLFIPPNEELREALEGLAVAELQAELGRRDPAKLESFNDSDRHNPRRLMRAIEIAEFKTRTPSWSTQPAVMAPLTMALTVGIQASLDVMEQAITQRVTERLEQGVVSEVEGTFAHYPNPKLPAFSATGVKDVLAYVQGNIDWEELKQLWSLHEFQYAKRQLTWWKKRSAVAWVDSTQPEWREEVGAQIQKIL